MLERRIQAMPWIGRTLWLAVLAAGSFAVSDALAGRSGAVRGAATVGAWTGWGITLIALAVLSTASLTAVRALVPGAVVVSVATATAGARGITVLVFVVVSIVATLAVATAEFGRAFVQASAYGHESRFGLRPPLGYAIAVGLTWVVAMTALVVALVSWPAEAWVPAVAATVVVGAAIVLLPARWHQLTRRWLVVVPAGVVVHDPVVLADTVMVHRRQIVAFELAPAAGDAADLSGPTPGPLVRIELSEHLTFVYAPTPADRKGRAVHAAAFVVAPSRPGAVLAALAARR